MYHMHMFLHCYFTSLQSSSVDERVLRPLQQLTELCQGPGRLCQKRQDKLMDFTAAAARLRQNKDGAKKQLVRGPVTIL